MICTTIQGKSYNEIRRVVESCEMAEIRLDRCRLSIDEIRDLFESEIPLVATCRVAEMRRAMEAGRTASEYIAAGRTNAGKTAAGQTAAGRDSGRGSGRTAEAECEARLTEAVKAGAAYVDVEVEAPKEMIKRIRSAAHKYGTVFIVSSHDFSRTGTYSELKATAERCFHFGADVAKVVTTARSGEDPQRVAALYDDFDPANLIAFCMGGLGRQSRVDCLKYGARFTYAALNEGDEAAPGQWAVADMMRAVYGGRRFFGIDYSAADRLAGGPGDCSGVGAGAGADAGVGVGLGAGAGAGDGLGADDGKRFGSDAGVGVGLGFGADGGEDTGSGFGADMDGAVRMPASKSFAQRAIIAAALADGESHLTGYTPCSDSEAALDIARTLGAAVSVVPSTPRSARSSVSFVPSTDPSVQPSEAERQDADPCAQPDGMRSSTITIRGVGAKAGSVNVPQLNVGESGLLTRLMIPLTAMVSSCDVTLLGEKTLLTRSLKGASEMMSAFGVRLSGETVPLKISGTLSEGRAEITGRYGSQLISGLLMAEPLAAGSSTVTVTEPKSIPYMFITTDVMRQFGVQVRSEMEGDGRLLDSDGDWSACTGITFKVRGGQAYRAADIELEADWSAAANFLVAGAVFGKAVIEGLDTTSLQADISIMDILIAAGSNPVQMDGDRGPIVVRRSPLLAFEADATDCPDLFPIVSVLAAFCEGTSRIAGVDRLAHKESDRGAAILAMLAQMGVPARMEGNSLVIEGRSLARRHLTGTLLRGGDYTSCHDHRMAMALKVAELGAGSPVRIDDAACVAKSFPAFFDTFRRLRHAAEPARPDGSKTE